MDFLKQELGAVIELGELQIEPVDYDDGLLMRRECEKRFGVALGGTYFTYPAPHSDLEEPGSIVRYLFELFTDKRVHFLLEPHHRSRNDLSFVLTKGQNISILLGMMYEFPFFATDEDLSSAVLSSSTGYMSLFGGAVDWAATVRERTLSLGHEWGRKGWHS